MRILCDAAPFGYGPIGKLLAIIGHFPDEWYCTIIGQNTSQELAEYSKHTNVISCNTESIADLANIKHLFYATDLFINVMNPVSALFAAELGIPTIQVDSLFWMWDTLPTQVLDATYYFIQNFPGVLPQLGRLKPANPQIVGPIIDTRFRTSVRRNQLLINFGGMSSHLIVPGQNSFYPNIVSDVIVKSIVASDYDRIIVTGGSKGLAEIRSVWKLPNTKVVTLGHTEFLKELDQSSLLMTSPGLTTSLESMAYHTPVIFLPPQNFSQFKILETFQISGIAQHSVHWRDLYPAYDLKLGITEESGVNAVLDCISRFTTDRKAQEFAIEKYRQAFKLDLKLVSDHQDQFFKELGNSGIEAIVQVIRDLA